jgi:signal transduction histidine kinase
MARSGLAPPRAGTSPSRSPPTPALLWAIALAGCAAAASSFALALTSDAVREELGEPLAIAVLVNWITLSYVLCGLLAWRRRPASRFGQLMIVAGFANFLSTLSWTSPGLSFTLGQALDLVPPVLFLHVCLAFPTGRVQRGFERRLISAAYATAIGLQLVRMAFGDFGAGNLLAIASEPDVALAAMRVQFLAVSAFCLCGIGVLAARRRRGGRPLRRSLALLVDSFALGLVMIAVLFTFAVFSGPAVRELRWAALATLGIAPVAFLFGLLHERLARSALGALVVEIRSDPTPASLRDALARALRDPSLTLAYWLPQFRSWADLDGRSLALPAEGSGRSTTLIERNGAQVAALLHDPALADEPELLAAVAAAAEIALENGRLHVELKARLEELRGSRLRVLDAGQKERKRLERNLHDGAQQRLVALSLELSLLEAQLADDDDARARIGQARSEIAASLAELREVAHGIHPAVVSGHGLAVALEQLAARAAVPISLTVDLDGRLPEALEVAAYYLVAESLANVGKYAQASAATVKVDRCHGRLVVEVVDDGIGGADTERGSGLRGLADRVEALEGRLQVWSPGGGGTRVRAEIPCAP